jgi:hypothetical protein
MWTFDSATGLFSRGAQIKCNNEVILGDENLAEYACSWACS